MYTRDIQWECMLLDREQLRDEWASRDIFESLGVSNLPPGSVVKARGPERCKYTNCFPEEG